MSEQHDQVFTIGHSTHTLEKFVALLRKHDVTTLVDVRSTPFSRFNPQFNRDSIKQELKAKGIKYVFMGCELGARSDDPSCYENGRVQYSRLAQTPSFREGIARLKAGARDHRIAVMCAEQEPLECHRTLLVARTLEAEGIAVEHILSDGRLEPHSETMERLLDFVGFPHEDLFRSKEELMTEALSCQENRIAYKGKDPIEDESGEAA